MTQPGASSGGDAPGVAATVAVGIPVHNGSRYLEEAIRSVQSQTMTPGSFLIFDNASTDSSARIAKKLLGAESVIISNTNVGSAQNFNRAVHDSQGEFFMWLASDDFIDPKHIATCLDVLRSQPQRPACLPGIRFVDRDGRHLRATQDPLLGSVDPRVRFRSYLRRLRWTEIYCLYRRDDLLRSPMLSQEFGTDVVLMWWFLLRGPLAITDEPLLNYREYSKTVADVSASIDPAMKLQHWRKCRLWATLWNHTNHPDLDHVTGRIARQELLLCIASRYGLWHLADDMVEIVTQGADCHPATRRAWACFINWLRVILRRPQT